VLLQRAGYSLTGVGPFYAEYTIVPTAKEKKGGNTSKQKKKAGTKKNRELRA